MRAWFAPGTAGVLALIACPAGAAAAMPVASCLGDLWLCAATHSLPGKPLPNALPPPRPPAPYRRPMPAGANPYFQLTEEEAIELTKAEQEENP